MNRARSVGWVIRRVASCSRAGRKARGSASALGCASRELFFAREICFIQVLAEHAVHPKQLPRGFAQGWARQLIQTDCLDVTPVFTKVLFGESNAIQQAVQSVVREAGLNSFFPELNLRRLATAACVPAADSAALTGHRIRERPTPCPATLSGEKPATCSGTSSSPSIFPITAWPSATMSSSWLALATHN